MRHASVDIHGSSFWFPGLTKSIQSASWRISMIPSLNVSDVVMESCDVDLSRERPATRHTWSIVTLYCGVVATLARLTSSSVAVSVEISRGLFSMDSVVGIWGPMKPPLQQMFGAVLAGARGHLRHWFRYGFVRRAAQAAWCLGTVRCIYFRVRAEIESSFRSRRVQGTLGTRGWEKRTKANLI